jgi:uncharacterized membrane protein
MPTQIASHWNAQGRVDDYMSKYWGLFLLPFTLVGLLLLFMIIPKIDPLKTNIEAFRKYYDRFIVIVIIFLFYVYLLTIIWNLGVRFDMIQCMIPALGVLFYYMGIVLEKVKMNWFIGIRTPWTLSSEVVWNKTHTIGGKLFKIAGVVTLFGSLFKDYALFFILIPVILVATYTIVYSYLEYQKILK